MTHLLLLAVLQAVGPSGRPADFLGFEPGSDSMLADWRQVSGYMNDLAQRSRYVRVDTLGRTTEGRPFLLMTITSPANQERLAEIKRVQALLADPRRLTDTALADIRTKQPAVILISNNIHSTEVASRSEEHTSELQSQSNLVCRLLLEKKKKKRTRNLVRN